MLTFILSKRNQTILPSNLSLVTLIWMGEKTRSLPHDKGLMSYWTPSIFNYWLISNFLKVMASQIEFELQSLIVIIHWFILYIFSTVDLCSDNPCHNNGVCQQTGATTFVCSCPLGYTGLICLDVNECIVSNPCQNGAVCTDTAESYTCTCVGQFTGINCQYGKSINVFSSILLHFIENIIK